MNARHFLVIAALALSACGDRSESISPSGQATAPSTSSDHTGIPPEIVDMLEGDFETPPEDDPRAAHGIPLPPDLEKELAGGGQPSAGGHSGAVLVAAPGAASLRAPVPRRSSSARMPRTASSARPANAGAVIGGRLQLGQLPTPGPSTGGSGGGGTSPGGNLSGLVITAGPSVPGGTAPGGTVPGGTVPGGTVPGPSMPVATGVGGTGSVRPPPIAQVPSRGSVRVLIYNVAGLPGFVSSGNPKRNMPKISSKLNTYPIVLVQESFWYYKRLRRHTRHPFRSRPQRALFRFPIRLVSDGLNRFAQARFTDFRRVHWRRCYGLRTQGNDCLARKGFSVARHSLTHKVTVDIYNLHADAGGSPGDQSARAAQFDQLAAFMSRYSAGRAVIVAGDTNLKTNVSPDKAVLDRFLARTGTQELARALGQPEEIDKFIWRSAPNLELRPTLLTEAKEFVDSAGKALSDHPALYADFDWRKR